MTASRQEKKMTLKHRGKETLAMIQLKVTSIRGISYQKKRGGTTKYKGIRLNYIWVQYLLSPLQHLHMSSGQIRSDQISRSVVSAHQASLSITNSRSSLRLMSIKSVMPSSHLILCHPLLLLPPIPPASKSFPMSQLFA